MWRKKTPPPAPPRGERGRKQAPVFFFGLSPSPGGGQRCERAGGPSTSLLRVHLGMSGQFTVVLPRLARNRITCTSCSRSTTVTSFGSVTAKIRCGGIFPDRAAVEAEMNAELGPEPFGIDANYFARCGSRHGAQPESTSARPEDGRRVGNIYADEACFRAQLHPGRKGKSLSPEECDRLRESIEAVMTRAIESRGSDHPRLSVGGSGLRGGFRTSSR